MRANPAAGLSAGELAQLRGLLLAKREELRRRVGTLQSELGSDAGNPAEPMDKAEVSTEQGDEIGVLEPDRVTLAQVEGALSKIDRGSYGLSEESQEPIGFRRLRAVPWARFTEEEEEARERRR